LPVSTGSSVDRGAQDGAVQLSIPWRSNDLGSVCTSVRLTAGALLDMDGGLGDGLDREADAVAFEDRLHHAA
jgi:hypothetical protein